MRSQVLEIHVVKEGTVISPDWRSSEKFIYGIEVLPVTTERE
jgi:hypothetical protein